MLGEVMSTLVDIYLPVLRTALRLGLIAPCLIKRWPQWWQETRFVCGESVSGTEVYHEPA